MLIIILTLGNSACVLLEGEAEHGDALVRYRVEHALDDALAEANLLVLVHVDHLPAPTERSVFFQIFEDKV